MFRAPHISNSEYLRFLPIKSQYASEFGHLLRVLMIYAEVEQALDYLTGLKGHYHFISDILPRRRLTLGVPCRNRAIQKSCHFDPRLRTENTSKYLLVLLHVVAG